MLYRASLDKFYLRLLYLKEKINFERSSIKIEKLLD